MHIGHGRAVDIHTPCLWAELCALWVCESYILYPHSPAWALNVPSLILPSLLRCSLSSPNQKTGFSNWFYSALKLCEPQAQLFLPLLPHL